MSLTDSKQRADRPSPHVVTCRGVTKEFKSGSNVVRALRGVDLQVRSGELLLLVGPSGCGKTTLLSVIAGILDPTAGEVKVLGVEISRLSSGRSARFRSDHLGFVFQQFNLFPALTALENVAVPLIIAGKSRRQALAAAADVIASVDLSDRKHNYPAQLSGGQQQRVAIARALINDPQLIVCDEPTSALDEATGRTVMELLRNVAVQNNRSVIVVTHDQRVYEFGDRLVEMNDGTVIREEVLKSPLASDSNESHHHA